jgi:hypothetical protein
MRTGGQLVTKIPRRTRSSPLLRRWHHATCRPSHSQGALHPPSTPRQLLHQPRHRPTQQHLARVLGTPHLTPHLRMRPPVEMHRLDDPLVALGKPHHRPPQRLRPLLAPQGLQRPPRRADHRVDRRQRRRQVPTTLASRVVTVLLHDLPQRPPRQTPLHRQAVHRRTPHFLDQFPTGRLHDLGRRLQARQLRTKPPPHELTHPRQPLGPPGLGVGYTIRLTGSSHRETT